LRKYRRTQSRRRVAQQIRSCVSASVCAESLERRSLLSATTIQLTASSDTTIYDVPAGDLANGAGEYLLAGGPLGESGVRRGIVYFDVGSIDIPAGATVVDVVLSMHLSQSVGGAASVSVNKVLSSWGEAGSDAPGSEIEGAPAEQLDATWLFSYFDGAAWSNPGGDFGGASASTVVDQIGTYEWFGGDLVADVQGWLDNSFPNFGWMIIGNESTANNKSFDSSDSQNAVLHPTLEITYEESVLPGVIEGRKWNDLDGNGLRVSASVRELDLQAHHDNLYYNAFGGNEYWYRSAESGSWYFLTKSGDLTRWSGQAGQLTGHTVAALDGRFYHNPDALHGEAVRHEPWLNGFTFELLDPFGTVVDTTVSRDIDFNGDGTIDEETERGWYRFENVMPGDYTVREVQQPGWVQSASRTSPLAATVYDLDSSLGLRVSGSLYTDYGGLGEKWLKGDVGWFYLTPTGKLFQWDGVPVTETKPLSGTLVAEPGIPYFRDPALIHEAENPVLTVSAGAAVIGVDFGNYQPAVISGRKWHDKNPDGVRNPPEMRLVDGTDGSSGSEESGGLYYTLPGDGDYYIDPDGNVFRIEADGTMVYITSMSSAATQEEHPGEWIFFEEPWLNGWTFELLDEDGNVIDSSTSADRDLNQDGTIDPEEERGWYVFEDVIPGTYTVREVQQSGWIQTAPAAPEYAQIARELHDQYGFQDPQNDYFDFGGRSERWLQGRGGEWYFITPNGDLYDWDRNSGGSHGPARGTLIAELSPSFFLNPSLLVRPAGTTVSVLSNDFLNSLNFGNHKVEEGLFGRVADELLENF
jgi:hypothetical protein